MTNYLRGATAFIGLGKTAVNRQPEMTFGGLAVEASRRAIADAGLRPNDIDCVIAYTRPTEMHTQGMVDGLERASVAYVQEGLGIETLRHHADIWGPGANAFAPSLLGAQAIHSGQARYVLVYAVLGRPLKRKFGELSTQHWGGAAQFALPYGFGSNVQTIAVFARRYMHENGLSREDLWRGIANGRKWAMRNQEALLGEWLSYGDYLSARMIADPMSLYDCDMPVFGAWAFVIAAHDDAVRAPKAPAYISAIQLGQGPRPTVWELWDDYTVMAPSYAGRDLWENAGVRPDEIDVAQIYDGFSPLIYFHLDAIGLTKGHDGPDFVRGVLEGDDPFPVNTFGGPLGYGKAQGAGHLYEAVSQARGDAGHRQVAGCDVSVATMGGFMVGATAVITRERRR
jgi:acetyl-CoA acetyltransferase